MTGAFLRVEREGKWENIEVEHLTKDELEDIIGSRSKAEIMDWMHMMASVLRLVDASFEKRDEDDMDGEVSGQ